MRFDGSSGRRPSSEARRHVLGVMANAILTDLIDGEFGLARALCVGLEDEADRRRVLKEARKLARALEKKAGEP